MKNRHRLILLAALLLGGQLAPAPAGAADTTATLTGTVADEQGQPLEGARVTMEADGVRTTQVRTDPNGQFRFPALRVGTVYTLTVEHEGYRGVSYSGLRLNRGRTRTMDFRLKRPGEREVVVFLSEDPFPYHDMMRGLLQVLDVPMRVYDLDQEVDPAATVRRVRAERPNLILGAGLRAARLLRREVREIPVILTLISDPRRYDLEAVNICFVANNPVPEDLTRRFRSILPQARDIGLVYEAQASSLLARDIRRALRKSGLKTRMRPCYDAADLEEALDDLLGRIDALVVPYDELTATPEAVDLVTGWALRHRIPLAAPGPEWVRRGALFSYGATLESIGMDVSWIASQILFHGRTPEDFHLRAPKNHVMAVNEGTAVALSVTIPADLNVDLTY